jgi:hypothetical protein
MPLATYRLEAELSGSGAGWTDLWADVRQDVPVKGGYGIRGNGPADRVASPGSLSFALDNSKFNSGGVFGYYSPDHASCRSGFAIGIAIRLVWVYGGITKYKWRGTLHSIKPTPNVLGGPWLTHCVAVDWMDEASRTNVDSLAIQINKRSDELWTLLLASVPRPPAATVTGTGLDTYPYAFDNTREEGISVMEEAQRLAMSEAGYIYQIGDTTQGGTVVFESRTDRALKNTNLSTLDNTMYDLVTGRSRDDIINRFLVDIHPRRVDAAATTVLFDLTSTNAIIALGAGETKTIVAPYTDPAQRDTRVGGTSMVAPVATTDYLLNSASDGSGSNLTASLAVTATFYANVAFLQLTNSGGTAGYVTKLQLRGKGIYDMQHVVFRQEDASSKTQFGAQACTYAMPYQSDPNVGDGAARHLLGLYKSQTTNTESVALSPNRSDALMQAARDREPGDRIGLAETQTGLTVTTGFFIQAVDFEIAAGNIAKVTWLLAPSSRVIYWLVGVVGASEVGETTIPGF